MARLRYNNALGLLGASLSPTGTTITFGTAPPFATISSADDYIPLLLDPPSSAPSASFEVVYLTAYTAGQTTGTISRGKEGTTGVSHTSGATWLCGPTAADEVNKVVTTKAFTGLTQGTPVTSTMTAPARACALYQFLADQPCWVRFYATQAQAIADLSRWQDNDPVGNHGCLLDMVIDATHAGQVFNLSPEVVLHDQDSGGGSTFYCNVRCDNGTTLNVTLTGLTLMP